MYTFFLLHTVPVRTGISLENLTIFHFSRNELGGKMRTRIQVRNKSSRIHYRNTVYVIFFLDDITYESTVRKCLMIKRWDGSRLKH
jgi:hypothetical protein